MIYLLELKDYNIPDGNGGLMTVKGDILIGTFTGKENVYFYGSYFTIQEDGKYGAQGTGELTKEQFKERVKTSREIF